MRIIPAIDIIDGKCVRLTKGDYATKKVYNQHPPEVAKEFEDNGIKYLHLIDLDGAKSQQIVNHRILERIASQTQLKIDFGGGIKRPEDIRIAFESGAHQVTVGSLAINNPDLFLDWLEQYGAEKIILGADCRNRMIATNGWLSESQIDVIRFIEDYTQKGIRNVICTDISKDGMLEGTSNELYCEILNQTEVNLIASGGVSSLEDIRKLEEIGCEGVILGKAIYEGRITLKELKEIGIE